METKKKVKSISSSKVKKGEDSMNKNNIKNYEVDASDLAIIKAYENKSKNRLKVFIAYILGIISTIALFSFLGISNNNINTNTTKNDNINNGGSAYIGILMVNLDDEAAIEHYQLDDIETNLKRGVVVETIASGGPAAGRLKRGDIITAFNKKTVTSIDDILDNLKQYKPGNKVTFTIERDGRTKNVNMILGSK